MGVDEAETYSVSASLPEATVRVRLALMTRDIFFALVWMTTAPRGSDAASHLVEEEWAAVAADGHRHAPDVMHEAAAKRIVYAMDTKTVE